VHAQIATAVNPDGRREILGLGVACSEDGAGWLAFLRGLWGSRTRPFALTWDSMRPARTR
jgi:transposase-like protein